MTLLRLLMKSHSTILKNSVTVKQGSRWTHSAQLESEPELAAVHYCTPLYPESLETATLLRNIANQLVLRFPNLVIPKLTSVTIITHQVDALEHLMVKPLLSLPRPKSPLFVLIDGCDSEILLLVTLVSQFDLLFLPSAVYDP
ncbi:unnamed protein product [Toxocara canis]|uniref:Glyco_trans_2-like domain-containing protein n=1 Tax=Toxocara canis TaxID=6265 RepID=A0A183V0S1_TOXCA|nr:unnamed protein product [Toxocara canis]